MIPSLVLKLDFYHVKFDSSIQSLNAILATSLGSMEKFVNKALISSNATFLCFYASLLSVGRWPTETKMKNKVGYFHSSSSTFMELLCISFYFSSKSYTPFITINQSHHFHLTSPSTTAQQPSNATWRMVTTRPSPSHSPCKRLLTILQKDAAAGPAATRSIPPQALPLQQPQAAAAVDFSPKAAPAVRPSAPSRTDAMHWQREARARRRRVAHELVRGSRELPQLHRCRADSRVPALVLELLLRPGRRPARAPRLLRASDLATRGILDFRRPHSAGQDRVRGRHRLRSSDSMTLDFRHLLGPRRVRRDQARQPRRLRVGEIRRSRPILDLPCILARWGLLLPFLPLPPILGLWGMILPRERYHLRAVSPEMGVEDRLRFPDLIQVRMLDLHHLKTTICGFQAAFRVLCRYPNLIQVRMLDLLHLKMIVCDFQAAFRVLCRYPVMHHLGELDPPFRMRMYGHGLDRRLANFCSGSSPYARSASNPDPGPSFAQRMTGQKTGNQFESDPPKSSQTPTARKEWSADETTWKPGSTDRPMAIRPREGSIPGLDHPSQGVR